MDGNQPEFVIMPYSKFEKMDNQVNSEDITEDTKKESLDAEALERLNQEIIALKEEIRQKESAELLIDDNPENRQLGEENEGVIDLE